MEQEKKGKVLVKILKVAGWTIVSVVLLLAVLLFCAVKFINSKDLAPMIEDVANDYIEGHLKLGKVKLGFNPGFPILGVEVDDLSIISHAFDSLSVEQRGLLPNYTDSLVTLDRFTGSLNLKRLIVDNEIMLHDVVLSGLKVNLVIAHNGKANYEIINLPDDTVKVQKSKIPGFRIDRFALDQPKEIRFYNASDSTSASVLLLTDAAVDGNKQPTYRLKVSGNVTSPKATLITNLEKINFGLNGKVYWDPANPGLVALDEMEVQGAFLKAVVSGQIDLKESPIVQKGIVDIKPFAIADVLTMVPDSIRSLHRLYEPYFSTDATISGRVELTKPMNLATDTIPTATIQFSIPPSHLNYGKAKFENLALDITVNTETNLPDNTVVNISKFTVDGPGTELQASALVTTPMSDPSFDGNVAGKVDFRNLPPILLEKIPGYLAGAISTDLKAKGSVSMFRPERLHYLVADGSVTADNVYFLSADTSKMVEVGKARIDFDSKRIVNNMPLLKANIAVDTATILVSGVDLALGAISLNAGVENSGLNAQRDTTRMMPIAGNLKVGRFNIISITDSAGARIRNIGGRVRMQDMKRGKPMLGLSTDLNIGNVSAGSLSDRVLLHNTKVKASLSKMPSKSRARHSAKKKSVSHKEYSYISPKDVYKYVYYKRTHRPRTKRVYGDLGADDEELLVWNLTKQFKGFLNSWKLSGSVNTYNARLLTPLFPLRNRISTVSLKFSNDTINISNISLTAGRSDIAISGLVTNVSRAMTSYAHNDLKGNLSLLSDTIDINELSAAVFTGASYASDRRHGKTRKIKAADDEALESRLDALSKKGPGKSSPVLIPVNIDAKVKVGARNLLYSDFDLHNMGGELLMYDGGVNIHNLKANSDAGDVNISALYSAPKVNNMYFGFGMEVNDFDISKFVKLVPSIDSITPLMHDFSGTIDADIAATCRLDSGMNINLPSLNAAIRIQGDNLAFIDPKKYQTLGKWLGFKNKTDNRISQMNVDMTVEDGLMRVYPFAFNIDRYRLGIYGHNDINMDFDYHLAVLKSPIPFRFGVTISGNPKKYKVRFGGAKFKEDTAIESVNIVNKARINLMDQIEDVFKRGVQNSRFSKLNVARPADFEALQDPGLSAADSLQLIKEGLLDAPSDPKSPASANSHKDKHKNKNPKDKNPKDKKQKDKNPKEKKHKRFLFF